jgi:tetratricopeptide (TPR) repeat protein
MVLVQSMTFPSVVRSGIALLCAGLFGGIVCAEGVAAPRPASPPADTTDNPQIQKYLIQGTTEAQLGDYREAILYFKTALDEAPNEPALLQALADAHEAQGDVATALFYARQARTHGTERPYYYHRLAELQQEAGDPQAALQTYQNLLSRFPENGAAYRAFAALQADLGRPEAALDTYNTLLQRVDRPSVAVYRKMLALYRRTGDADGIEKTLRILTERRPNNRTYRRRLGEHYAEENRSERALDLLAPLARQQPADAALQQRVRRLSQETGRATGSRPADASSPSMKPGTMTTEQLVQKARSAYDEALSSSAAPDSTRLRRAEALLQHALDRAAPPVAALSLRARIHRQKGEYRAAGQVLERALDKNPRDADRWTRAASAYRRAKEYKKAASVSEEGLLLFPGHAPLARTAAFARLRSGSPKRALDHFRKALDLFDDAASRAETAVLRAGLGLAYTHLDRPTDAAEAFEAARAPVPTPPAVLRSHAYSLALRSTDLDRALKMARRAVEQSPSDPLFLDTLGWVYFKRENLEAARRHLQRALDAGLPSARLLEHSGDVQHALGNDAAARTYWQKARERAPDRSSLRKKLGDGPSS